MITFVLQYDAKRGGEPGVGEEHVVQKGFGWTNGVALLLLNKYAGSSEQTDRPTPVDAKSGAPSFTAVANAILVVGLVVLVVVFVSTALCVYKQKTYQIVIQKE